MKIKKMVDEKTKNEPIIKQTQSKTTKKGYELKLKESDAHDDEFEKY